MALFSVGFKVEAKAYSLRYEYNSTTLEPTAYVTFNANDFDSNHKYELGLRITNSSNPTTPEIGTSMELNTDGTVNGEPYTVGTELPYPVSKGTFETWAITYPFPASSTDIKVQAYLKDKDTGNDVVDPTSPQTVAGFITLQDQFFDCIAGTYENPSFKYEKGTYPSGVTIKVKVDNTDYTGPFILLKGDSKIISCESDGNKKDLVVFRGWEKKSSGGSIESQDNQYTIVGTGGNETYIADYTELKFIFPSNPVEIYKDEEYSITPKYDKEILAAKNAFDKYELSPASGDSYYEAEVNGEYIELRGIKATTSSPRTLKVTPKFRELSLENPDYTMNIKVLDYPYNLEDVYINYGLTVYLKDYMSYDSDKYIIDVTDRTGGLIKIDSKSASEIGMIKVEGLKSGTTVGKVNNYIQVDPGELIGDATVYPKPTLSKSSGSNSSNSSSDYKLTITMPAGVHYANSATDNVRIDDLTQTQLEYKSSSGDEKTRSETHSLDSNSSTSNSSSNSSLTKKKEVSKSKKELTNIFKDICSGDEDTVKVKAYAYHDGEKDKKIVSNEETYKAYKISLDTSAGASYTVDGDSVSGNNFYGIDGASYTIKASPTNGGTLDRTNSGEFNSGETITYRVSGSKTLKAVYITPTPTPSTTTSPKNTALDGNDPYDEAPKTGESKADIWILWSVLLISILGAAFMIRKRFGLVRAIAAADEEMAQAVREEKIETEKKEKESKIQMLKDLRKL